MARPHQIKIGSYPLAELGSEPLDYMAPHEAHHAQGRGRLADRQVLHLSEIPDTRPLSPPRRAQQVPIPIDHDAMDELNNNVAQVEEELDIELLSASSTPSVNTAFSVEWDDYGHELVTEGKKDADMAQRCVEFVLEWVAGDRTGLDEWARVYAPGLRRRMVEDGKGKWRIDVRGLLVPAGSWTSLLRPAVFIVPAPLAVSPTESLVVIAWATFTDARNTSLRFIMQLLPTDEDLAEFRMLLVVRCIRLRQATEKAVYLITAPGAIDYALLADIAAGRKPYTEARRRPEDLGAYGGHTIDGPKRAEQHTSETTDPVNKKMAALRQQHGARRLEVNLAVACRNQTPIPVLHTVESMVITLFRLTVTGAGGYNFNLMDSVSWDELWDKEIVTRFLQTMQRAALAAPTLGWPLTADQPAWEEICKAIFGNGEVRVLTGAYLSFMLSGRARRYLDRTNVNVKQVALHWKASVTTLTRAMSAEHRIHWGSKISAYVPGSGPRLLGDLVALLEREKTKIPDAE